MGVASQNYSAIIHPVYGRIELCDAAKELFETPQLERLKGVKQLGFKERYFLGPSHTRFSHSIGVAELAKRIGKRLGWSKKEIEKAEIVGVLHDVGHGPHSHASEDVIEFFTGKDHDQRTIDEIMSREVTDTLKKHGYSPLELMGDEKVVGAVRQVWKGYGSPSKANQHPNADELDYLTMDQYFTGVDLEMTAKPLVDNLVEIDGKLAISMDGLDAANRFVLASIKARHGVYMADVMDAEVYQRAIYDAVESGIISAEEFATLDDANADVLLSGIEKWSKSIRKSPEIIGEFGIVKSRGSSVRDAIQLSAEKQPFIIRLAKDGRTYPAYLEEGELDKLIDGLDASAVESVPVASRTLKKSEFHKFIAKKRNFRETVEIEKKLAKKYGVSYVVTHVPDSPFGKGCELESIPVPEVRIMENDGSIHSLYEYHPKTAQVLREKMVKSWYVKVAISKEDAERLSKDKKQKLAHEALKLLLED